MAAESYEKVKKVSFCNVTTTRKLKTSQNDSEDNATVRAPDTTLGAFLNPVDSVICQIMSMFSST